MGKMEDIRQSEAYARFIKSIGWKVERIQGVNVFIRGLRIAKIQRADVPIGFPKIPGVLMAKLEPLSFGSLPKRFKQDGWPLLSTRTIRVDLAPDLEKVRSKFKKDCRYCLRKANSSEFMVHRNKFDGFYELWKKAAKIKHLWVPPKWQYEALITSFGDNAFCITIDDLAGAVVLMHDRTAYYYYAACLPAGKLLHLPYLIVWECMKEAKKRGCTIWDFKCSGSALCKICDFKILCDVH